MARYKTIQCNIILIPSYKNNTIQKYTKAVASQVTTVQIHLTSAPSSLFQERRNRARRTLNARGQCRWCHLQHVSGCEPRGGGVVASCLLTEKLPPNWIPSSCLEWPKEKNSPFAKYTSTRSCGKREQSRINNKVEKDKKVERRGGKKKEKREENHSIIRVIPPSRAYTIPYNTNS